MSALLKILRSARVLDQECARAGGSAPTGQALTRFLPWTASTDDLIAWAHNPHRRVRGDPEPDTTEPDTGSDARPADDQPQRPGTITGLPDRAIHHEPDHEPADNQRPSDSRRMAPTSPFEPLKPTPRA